jgi:hypothetical protein
VPYALRLIDYRLEIYPSVVLPFGASKARPGEEMRLEIYEIYGYSEDGNLKNLDKSRFLQNIRVGYFDFLYEDRFGLKESAGKNFITNRLGLSVSMASKISAEDKAATVVWLRERLRDQACKDSVLILKKKQVVIPKDGQYYVDKTLVHDTIIRLN